MDSPTVPQDFSVEDNGYMVVKATGKTVHVVSPEDSNSTAMRLARVVTGALFPTEKEKVCLRFPG